MKNYFNTLTLSQKIEQLGKCRFMNPSEFGEGVNALKNKTIINNNKIISKAAYDINDTNLVDIENAENLFKHNIVNLFKMGQLEKEVDQTLPDWNHLLKFLQFYQRLQIQCH